MLIWILKAFSVFLITQYIRVQPYTTNSEQLGFMLRQIILWRFFTQFNLVNTFYDLFCHICMSPDSLFSHMKLYLIQWQINSINWYSIRPFKGIQSIRKIQKMIIGSLNLCLGLPNKKDHVVEMLARII